MAEETKKPEQLEQRSLKETLLTEVPWSRLVELIVKDSDARKDILALLKEQSNAWREVWKDSLGSKSAAERQRVGWTLATNGVLSLCALAAVVMLACSEKLDKQATGVLLGGAVSALFVSSKNEKK